MDVIPSSNRSPVVEYRLRAFPIKWLPLGSLVLALVSWQISQPMRAISTLMERLRALALTGTELERACAATIQFILLKISTVI